MWEVWRHDKHSTIPFLCGSFDSKEAALAYIQSKLAVSPSKYIDYEIKEVSDAKD